MLTIICLLLLGCAALYLDAAIEHAAPDFFHHVPLKLRDYLIPVGLTIAAGTAGAIA